MKAIDSVTAENKKVATVADSKNLRDTIRGKRHNSMSQRKPLCSLVETLCDILIELLMINLERQVQE